MSELLVTQAKDFAFKAHAGLMRFSNPKWPYTTHLAEVSTFVEASGGSDEERAAAWLHDTVEDTAITLADIEREFGSEVALLVDSLTDPPEYAALPNLERKTLQAKRILEKSVGVKRIKIADQTSNVRFLATFLPTDGEIIAKGWGGPQVSKDYFEGARRIVDNCRGISPYLEEEFDEAYQAAMSLNL